MFDEAYYTTNNYENYLERRPRYLHTAKNLIDLLNSISLLNDNPSILDFGCAVGFLLEGFKNYNIQGYDISEWAIKQAKEKKLPIVDNLTSKFDIMISLDVFEHMNDEDIKSALAIVDPKILIVRIPVSLDGNTFALDISRRDSTHINCKTKQDWINFLNYPFNLRINIETIYDTDGVMCCIFFK